MLGFLYLKVEDDDEPYYDIQPQFSPMKRLKVGTFKIDSTGFRLGERFIKIIFDNAIQQGVQEIYLTIKNDRDDLAALIELLKNWGFVQYGIKKSKNGEEFVFTKKLNSYDFDKSPRENFPNILYDCNKYILPIRAEFHTSILPDSKLNTENTDDFIEKVPYRYALQKVYISWADTHGAKPRDLVLFYRMGETGSHKQYSSVVTTVGMIAFIQSNFKDYEAFKSACQNRSVFTEEKLRKFWASNHRDNLKVIHFIFVKSLFKRPILKDLWDLKIVPIFSGPRPFTRISDSSFDLILKKSKTNVFFIKKKVF